MPEVFRIVFNGLVLVFVLSSMFDLGLSLTLKEITAPLKNGSLIAKALIANFVIAPLIAYLLIQVVGLAEPHAIGLTILAAAAGSPILAKLSKIAKGDLAYTVGLIVLLQVVTIVLAPALLTLLLENVEIDALAMLRTLVVTMLLPLIAGLFVKARYDEMARKLSPYMSQASSVTLMIQVALGLLLGAGQLIALFGTGAILAATLFAILTLIAGYFMGGPEQGGRIVTGLGTSQRSISASMLITIENFSDPAVLVMVITGAGLMMVINSLVAGEFGRRAANVESVLESAST
ncbi:MAG: bile acid:sodium symporter [Chloroflexota bacterium]